MKQIIFLLFLTSTFPSIYSQPRIDPKLDPRNYSGGFVLLSDNELCIKASDVSKYQVLDSAKMMVIYDKIYMENIATCRRFEEKMILLLGDSISAFFSHNMYLRDSIYTARDFVRSAATIEKTDPSITFSFFTSGYLSVVVRLPFASNRAIFYREKRPDFDWVIGDSTSMICGYMCHQATASYGNRDWIVWFCPDIPVNLGPWKFAGLPGLILRAEDTAGEYIFKAVALRHDSKPINWYRWHFKEMTKREWQQYEKKLYAQPYSYVNPSGAMLILSGEKHDGKYYLDEDNWSIPYNPIERE